MRRDKEEYPVSRIWSALPGERPDVPDPRAAWLRQSGSRRGRMVAFVRHLAALRKRQEAAWRSRLAWINWWMNLVPSWGPSTIWRSTTSPWSTCWPPAAVALHIQPRSALRYLDTEAIQDLAADIAGAATPAPRAGGDLDPDAAVNTVECAHYESAADGLPALHLTPSGLISDALLPELLTAPLACLAVEDPHEDCRGVDYAHRKR